MIAADLGDSYSDSTSGSSRYGLLYENDDLTLLVQNGAIIKQYFASHTIKYSVFARHVLVVIYVWSLSVIIAFCLRLYVSVLIHR